MGSGGRLEINTQLGDSVSPTEKLVLQGNTSGQTTLAVTNLGGLGAATTGNGILVVEVSGASDGTFALPGPGYVDVGNFRYTLAKVGNNWYLQSSAVPPVQPAAPAPVPTLQYWGLFVLSALTMGVAGFFIRRRKGI